MLIKLLFYDFWAVACAVRTAVVFPLSSPHRQRRLLVCPVWGVGTNLSVAPDSYFVSSILAAGAAFGMLLDFWKLWRSQYVFAGFKTAVAGAKT